MTRNEQEEDQCLHYVYGILNDHQECIRGGQAHHRYEMIDGVLDLIGATKTFVGYPHNIKEYKKKAG